MVPSGLGKRDADHQKLIGHAPVTTKSLRKMSSSASSATGIMSTAAPAKSAKSVAKKTKDAPAAPVAAPAPAATPASAAAAPAKKAKAVKAETTPAPVAAPVAAPAAETPAAPAEVVEEVRLEAEAKAITARLLAVRETVSELISEAKRLEKKAAKVQKLADKRRRKVPRVPGEGKPSVFEIPTNISPQLCAFLGRPAGSQESRSNVSRLVSEYIKAHNLKVEKSHAINADAKLRGLLGLKEGDALTYFNLQKYLNPHYLKAVPAPTTTA